MYSSLPSFVLGFHGCDKSIGEKIISGTDTLEHSHNAYDWLGHGAYFWENNPARALEYAKRLKEKAHNKKNIIIDLNEVDWMNSSGLGILIGAVTTLKNNNGRLALANVSDRISNLLRITKLADVFEVYETIDSAIESLK